MKNENLSKSSQPEAVAKELKTQPEHERINFKELLLGNPNYFGTFEKSIYKPIKPMIKNIAYEEIKCVGFNPQFNRLDAVVWIKQKYGYGGGICSSGTPEYVRFYLSFDDGATWQDQGMVIFTAYDILEAGPLEYAVTLQITPSKDFCFKGASLPQVRAILSWNHPPTPNNPNFLPVWGNVAEARVQIDALKIFILKNLMDESQVKIPEDLKAILDPEQSLAVAKPRELSAADLQLLYKDKKVPEHRFLFAEVNKLIAKQELTESIMDPNFKGYLSELGINFSKVIDAKLKTDGDTSYEELKCIGLNPTHDALVGVLTVKLSSGYSGNLCSPGSQEYVAFWVDWDDGAGWTYSGTTSANVHDINTIPPSGLQYSVFLPIDLDARKWPCQKGARTAKVRAILSWQASPHAFDPDYKPVWGNRKETLIHIKPGDEFGDKRMPGISSVGDIETPNIDANGKANGSAIHTALACHDSPFGGRITIAGKISNAISGLKYRVMRKLHNAPDSDYMPLTNEPVGLSLDVWTFNGINWVYNQVVNHADKNGYYPYEDYSSNHFVDQNILGVWYSNVAEDGMMFDLRVDLSVDGNPNNDVHSNVVSILIDNIQPNVELLIDLGSGVKCASFKKPDTIHCTFKTTDAHFQDFWFEILPDGQGASNGVLPVPPSGYSVFYSGAITDPGVTNGTCTIATANMNPCGYALILHAYDRTNVNSGRTYNYNFASVGFCVREG